jgi:pseudaminic acid biosynthesis-associated methylase
VTGSNDLTDQAKFWKGDFGDAYTDRNTSDAAQLRARTALWAKILDCMVGGPPTSVLEVGANIGNNLQAIKSLIDARVTAVEPNEKARARMINEGIVAPDDAVDAIASNLGFADGAFDLSFTSGVLIHIHPDDLPDACREIHRVTSRYLVAVEYFANKPEAIEYRGHTGFLFKRDFGDYYMESFPDLRLLDYGFAWKRATGLDDLTWWVFEKHAG